MEETSTKHVIRKRMAEIRRRLSPEQCARWSESVRRRLENMPAYKSCADLLTYVDSRDNELATINMITDALAKGRPVWIPISRPRGVLEWSLLGDLGTLARGRFDILEPKPGTERIGLPPQCGVVLVPGIAFSEAGQRIGHGAGYYDRFLARHDGPRIGLAYERQMVAAFETESFDIAMDYIVTEDRVLICTMGRASGWSWGG